MRKRSVKNNRINEEVLRELSNIIRSDLKDPRIADVCSVLSVEVAPDLKTAKAYVSVLGDEDAKTSTMEGLKASAGFVRSLLAKRLNLRNTPQIIFIFDASISYGIRMSHLIDTVITGRGCPPPLSEDGDNKF